MHFLIGCLVGSRIAETAGYINDDTETALWGIFWWTIVGSAGWYAAYANLGPAYSWAGQSAAMLLILLYCVRKPLSSGFKEMMLAAINLVARLGLLLCGGYVVVRLGWAAISGEIKSHGVGSLPLASLGAGAAFALFWVLVAAFVAYVVDRDFRRLAAIDRGEAERARAEAAGAASRDRAADGTANRAEQDRAERAAPPPPKRPAGPAWWETLGVPESCSLEEADAAAKALLREYHPDRWMHLPEHLRAAAEQRTKLILAARDQARSARRTAA